MPGVPMDPSGHSDHTDKVKYKNETVKPKQAREGSTSGEYGANGVYDMKSEMMNISSGMYGDSGFKQDQARIKPYMMYNDTTDQNGY